VPSAIRFFRELNTLYRHALFTTPTMTSQDRQSTVLTE
jgi:hypothetical protein